MFEKATRMRLRFNFKGQCSVEDLWSLKVNDLDLIYKDLRAEQRQHNDDDSLLATTSDSKECDIIALKIDIVTHIVKVKQAEREARMMASETAQRKAKLMKILEDKQDEELLNKSADEISKLISEL